MKKLLSFIMVLCLMITVIPVVHAQEYINVYSADGRVEVIEKSDFDAWHKVGWYSAPVMYVYSIDGRRELILKSDFNAWHAVGWYSAPVMYVYSIDGRSQIIPKDDYEAWRAVGWCSSTPMIVYSPDGRTQYIPKNEFPLWQSVGWYSAPVMYMYAVDGRVKLILKEDYAKWQSTGWYTKPVFTIYRGKESRVIPKEDFLRWERNGWYTYITIHHQNGASVTIASNDENIWKYCGEDWFRPNDPLSKVESSSNGTNISVEKAKEIAINYCEKMYPPYRFGYAEVLDYSDTSYFIVLSGSMRGDGLFCVSVNKTTGYVFECGQGSCELQMYLFGI